MATVKRYLQSQQNKHWSNKSQKNWTPAIFYNTWENFLNRTCNTNNLRLQNCILGVVAKVLFRVKSEITNTYCNSDSEYKKVGLRLKYTWLMTRQNSDCTEPRWCQYSNTITLKEKKFGVSSGKFTNVDPILITSFYEQPCS